jgi:hypothetical protein
MGAAARPTEVEMLVDQLAQAQVPRQRGRQQEPGIGHQMVIVESRSQPVEAVR